MVDIIDVLDYDDDDGSENDDDNSNENVDDDNENDNGNNADLYDVQLKRTVKRLNAELTVRNLHKYGPLTNDSLIIVVQV